MMSSSSALTKVVVLVVLVSLKPYQAQQSIGQLVEEGNVFDGTGFYGDTHTINHAKSRRIESRKTIG